MEEVLTTKNVADLLDCGEDQVELLARRRELPGLKFGRGWVFPKAALLHVLNNDAIGAMNKPAMPADPAEQPATAARAAVVPVGVELPPRRGVRQAPPPLSVVPKEPA